MKRIVADLAVVAQVEDDMSRCRQRPAVNVAVGESSGFAFIGIPTRGSQVRGEFLPHRLGDR